IVHNALAGNLDGPGGADAEAAPWGRSTRADVAAGALTTASGGSVAATGDEVAEGGGGEEHDDVVDRRGDRRSAVVDQCWSAGDSDGKRAVVDPDLHADRDRLALRQADHQRHEVADGHADDVEGERGEADLPEVLEDVRALLGDRGGDDEHEEQRREDLHRPL